MIEQIEGHEGITEESRGEETKECVPPLGSSVEVIAFVEIENIAYPKPVGQESHHGSEERNEQNG